MMHCHWRPLEHKDQGVWHVHLGGLPSEPMELQPAEQELRLTLVKRKAATLSQKTSFP